MYPKKISEKLGVGLGLRAQHYSHILSEKPKISWFEAISENYLGLSRAPLAGRPLQTLERVRSDYPVVLHGVSMSIGSADELDQSYLGSLKSLIEHIQPEWVSDHLCWTGVEGENLHDLLPLPYTEEALKHLTRKIEIVQETLGRRLVIENVSAYLSYSHSEMTEWEFLAELSARADCQLLIDVNNIYVSSVNLEFDPLQYLRAIPRQRVAQMHLAGHSRQGAMLIDTHDHPVPDSVWALYREALKLYGPVPTLIEWDDKIPEFEVLVAQAREAESILCSEASLAENLDA